jgi:hypothetical protein
MFLQTLLQLTCACISIGSFWKNKLDEETMKICSLRAYHLWNLLTLMLVYWNRIKMREVHAEFFFFSFFFCLLVFVFGDVWNQFKPKEFFCSHRKRFFFVGRKFEITTLISFASEVKKCYFFPTQEILSISFLFKSCYETLSIFPPITNQ